MDLNQIVTWKSQAGGFSKTKTGTIVEIVPAGKQPEQHKADGGSRDHKSYVVKVDQGGKRKPETYWPKVKLLTLASLSEIKPKAKANPKAKSTKRASLKQKLKLSDRTKARTIRRVTGEPDWNAALWRGIIRGIESGYFPQL